MNVNWRRMHAAVQRDFRSSPALGTEEQFGVVELRENTKNTSKLQTMMICRPCAAL